MAQQLKTFCGGKKKTKPFCWTTKDRSAGQTDLTHPHTHTRTQLSISQDTEGWKEQKKQTDENEFRLLTRTLANLSSSSPGSGMGSFRGMLWPLKSGCCSMLPAFPMFPLRATFHPHPSRSLILPLLAEKSKKKKKDSPRCEKSGGGGPSLSFVFPLHLQIYSLVTSSRTCEGGGVIKRWVRAALRPPMRHFQGTTGDGTRRSEPNPSFPSLLSVSCTISAPLPAGRNDAVHDSRLLQSAATVWEFSSLIPPLLLTS